MELGDFKEGKIYSDKFGGIHLVTKIFISEHNMYTVKFKTIKLPIKESFIYEAITNNNHLNGNYPTWHVDNIFWEGLKYLHEVADDKKYKPYKILYS